MSDENLIIIAGPSGAGKTTIAEHLEELLNIKNVVSSTTRKPRPNEVDGIHYHFYSHKEFLARNDDGEFLEYAPYKGHLYGTRYEDLHEALESGGLVLLVVEMEGVEAILRVYPEAQTFFITAPKVELVERLKLREIPEDERAERIAGLDKELLDEHSCLIKCLVHNPDGHFDEALKKVRETILNKVGNSFVRNKK